MKKNKVWLVVLLAFAVVLVGAYALYDKISERLTPDTLGLASSATNSESKNMAADFSAMDKDGNIVKLSDYKGTPVILNFWASWCPPCKAEMPDFQTAYETYGDDIMFMMVNLTDGNRETVEKATEHVMTQGYTFPVFFDTSSSAAVAYGITSIPSTYFIDADGNIVGHAVGSLSLDELEDGIALLMP